MRFSAELVPGAPARVLEGDGVHVILVGNTKIIKAVTTSTFASIPDVPVSSFTLTLRHHRLTVRAQAHLAPTRLTEASATARATVTLRG